MKHKLPESLFNTCAALLLATAAATLRCRPAPRLA